MSKTHEKKLVPIREGAFIAPLDSLQEALLAGSKCHNCGEVSFAERTSCPNCTSSDVETIALGRKGKLWTYTVIRHRPPGDYKGPEPFVPFGLGLVELPEGIRIIAPIDCDVDTLKINMELELDVYKIYENEEGNDVIAFQFKPI